MEAHWLQTRRGMSWAPLGNIHLHFSFSSEHVISLEYGSSRGTMREEKERERASERGRERKESRSCILSKTSTREEKKRVDYLINIARYSRWWIDKGSILVNASIWCMSFLPEEFVCVRPLSLFASGNVRVKQKEIGHNLQTHYEFGNEYQDTWGNREKLIFTLVMTKVFPLFRVLLMFAFLWRSSGLQQHTA